MESEKCHLSGIIIRDLSCTVSNYRSTKTLDEYLKEQNVLGRSCALNLASFIGIHASVVSEPACCASKDPSQRGSQVLLSRRAPSGCCKHSS